MPPMKTRLSIPVLAALAFLAMGILLRLWYFLDARSLFIDEANLALNISGLPYSHFFRPLLHDQYAPPLFMVCSKAAVQLLGNNEWALRLWPLAGGLLTLAAFYHLMKKLGLSSAIYWYPAAMLSLSPFMLRFTTEAKQYSTDAALALGAVILALHLPPERLKTRHYWIWAVAGGISLWFSMPVAFMLAGIGAYYFWGFARQKNGKAMMRMGLVGIAWAASFITLYLMVLRAGTEKEVLLDYHAPYFFPLRIWEAAAWRQMGDIFYGLLRPVLGFTVVGLITGVGLLLWGAYRLARQKTGVFLLIALPILAGFAASVFHLFSLIPRVSMFMMPLFLLLVACGASEAWKKGNLYFRLALLGLMILEAAPFANSLGQLGRSTEIENLKGVLTEIKQQGRPGPSYIDGAAVPAYRYYSQWHDKKQQYQLPGAVLLSWDSNLGSILEQGRQESRGFWLVFSQLISDEAREKRRKAEAIAGGVARGEVQVEEEGAAGVWYEYEKD